MPFVMKWCEAPCPGHCGCHGFMGSLKAIRKLFFGEKEAHVALGHDLWESPELQGCPGEGHCVLMLV